MKRVTIEHGGGYDPRKGSKHPDNQDATLERPSGYNKDKPTTTFVNADGSTETMQQVSARQKAMLKSMGRKRLDAAFKLRAGMIGTLQSCLCDYPLTRYEETTSGHHAACPAHGMFLARQRVEEREHVES